MARKNVGNGEQQTTADSARIETAAAATLVSATSHLLGTSDLELAGFFASFTRYASPEDLLHYSAAEFGALIRCVFARVTYRRAGETSD